LALYLKLVTNYILFKIKKFSNKLKIEKLVTQLSKSFGMFFKLKHFTTNISVLNYVDFAFFIYFKMPQRFQVMWNIIPTML